MIVSGSGPGVKVMHGGAGSGRHPGPVDVRGAKVTPVPKKGKPARRHFQTSRQLLVPAEGQNGARTRGRKSSNGVVTRNGFLYALCRQCPV